jgi:predicted kinase
VSDVPKLYVLVGVPGSGKSTWVTNQQWTEGCAIVSTDGYVEAYAQLVGKTYSDVFSHYMPVAVAHMADAIRDARDCGVDIIWDQTSTTIASRLKKFRMLPDYYKIAVVFRTPDTETLKRRLDSRPGKVVPHDVVEKMIEGWEEPTTDEGFDEIWYAG